jgi:hypothetical protein
LAGGDALVITYGAQGNAALLLNYGFCIQQNIEPDGSSNDVYELLVEPAASGKDEGAAAPGAAVAVPLRAGPKWYSYGGLVRALETVRAMAPPSQSVPLNESGEPLGSFPAGGVRITLPRGAVSRPDQDDITGSRDEPGGEDRDLRDRGSDADGDDVGVSDADSDDDGVSDADSDDDGVSDADAAKLLSEVNALLSFQKCLEVARSKYAGPDDEIAPVGDRDSCSDKKHYATLLIRSELRTLYFFQCAVHQILRALVYRSALHGHGAWRELHDRERVIRHHPPVRPSWVPESDVGLILGQVEELAMAYLKIRHPALVGAPRTPGLERHQRTPLEPENSC